MSCAPECDEHGERVPSPKLRSRAYEAEARAMRARERARERAARSPVTFDGTFDGINRERLEAILEALPRHEANGVRAEFIRDQERRRKWADEQRSIREAQRAAAWEAWRAEAAADARRRRR